MKKLIVTISLQLAAVFICSRAFAAMPVDVVDKALRDAGIPIEGVCYHGDSKKIEVRFLPSATTAQKTQAAQITTATDISPVARTAFDAAAAKADLSNRLSAAGIDVSRLPRKP